MQFANLQLPDGSSYVVDFSNVAFWPRFEPFALGTNDWKYYLEYKNKGGDTIGSRMRHTSVAQLLRRVRDKGVVGQVAECGCYKGHSTFIIASVLAESSRPPKFFVFDSFKGLSPLTEEDKSYTEGTSDFMGVRKDTSSRAMFSNSLEKLLPFFSEFEFLEFFEGWVPDRFDEVSEEQFSFVNLDLDLYEPTKSSLEFFFPRLSAGGVIHIDDYNFTDWPGVTKAVNDYLADKDYTLFYEIPLGGAFILK